MKKSLEPTKKYFLNFFYFSVWKNERTKKKSKKWTKKIMAYSSSIRSSAGSIPMMLQQKGVSYKDQAFFSNGFTKFEDALKVSF